MQLKVGLSGVRTPHVKAALLILKKKQLENARDMDTIEHLYTELEALEWLQARSKQSTCR